MGFQRWRKGRKNEKKNDEKWISDDEESVKTKTKENTKEGVECYRRRKAKLEEKKKRLRMYERLSQEARKARKNVKEEEKKTA